MRIFAVAPVPSPLWLQATSCASSSASGGNLSVLPFLAPQGWRLSGVPGLALSYTAGCSRPISMSKTPCLHSVV